MASVNRVTVIGNVGKDPEIRYNPSGVAFCTLSLATTRSWKDKQTGEKQEEVEWHRVTFNDKLAEIVGQYVKKGKPLYVEGRLRTRKWTNKEGVEVYTTEIIANEMQLLGSRDDAASTPPPQQRQQAPAPSPRRPGEAASMGSAGPTAFDDMDVDIPFALSLCDFAMTDGKARRLNRASF